MAALLFDRRACGALTLVAVLLQMALSWALKSWVISANAFSAPTAPSPLAAPFKSQHSCSAMRYPSEEQERIVAGSASCRGTQPIRASKSSHLLFGLNSGPQLYPHNFPPAPSTIAALHDAELSSSSKSGAADPEALHGGTIGRKQQFGEGRRGGGVRHSAPSIFRAGSLRRSRGSSSSSSPSRGFAAASHQSITAAADDKRLEAAKGTSGFGWGAALLRSLFGTSARSPVASRRYATPSTANSSSSGSWFPARAGGGIAFAAAEVPPERTEGLKGLLVPENAAFYEELNLTPLLNAPYFPLPELPWKFDALSPSISGKAIKYHFGRHHAAYAKNLNDMAAEDPSIASKSLRELVATAPRGPVFNNAAQLQNHTFFWRSMKPGGGGEPYGEINERIERSFGSWERFRKLLTKTALAHFGSGWIWLVVDDKGALQITEGHDAESPIRRADGDRAVVTPLLTIDVWEHAYYIDFRNARAKYIEQWFQVVNWDFANHNLEKWRAEKRFGKEENSVASPSGEAEANKDSVALPSDKAETQAAESLDF